MKLDADEIEMVVVGVVTNFRSITYFTNAKLYYFKVKTKKIENSQSDIFG